MIPCTIWCFGGSRSPANDISQPDPGAVRYTRCVDLHCREGSEGCLIFLPVRYPLHVCMTHLTGRGGCLYIIPVRYSLYVIPVRYSLYIIPVRWHHPCKMRILQGSGGALASTHTRYPYTLDIYLHQQKFSQSLVAQFSTHTERAVRCECPPLCVGVEPPVSPASSPPSWRGKHRFRGWSRPAATRRPASCSHRRHALRWP